MNRTVMTRRFSFKKVACLVLSLSLSACAYAPWKSANIFGDTPEEKVDNAKQKADKKPEDTIPRKDMRLTQEKAVNDLLQQADKAEQQGKLEEARVLYTRALTLDANNIMATAAMKAMERDQHHIDRIEEARTQFSADKLEAAQSIVREVLLENPNQKDALVLEREIKAKRGLTRSEPPKLKPPFDKPVTLELRDANIKMVFEALSRATGINFVLDKDIRPDTKATVFVKKVSVEEAIDMVLTTNGLQKKVLSETSALVFPSLPQKVKDYQDLKMRSFYLTNSTAKQAGAMLRTMLKAKDIFVDDRLNMLVIRDTPEVIRVAEKLIAANDMADPEVMLEIEVMEVSRSRLQELGIDFPSRIAVNNLVNVPSSVIGSTGFVSNTSTLTEQPLTIKSLQTLGAGSLSVSPNPAVNFRKTIGDVNILSNPRIRVRNNEKAKILVGDKVPIITSNVTGTASTVTESVQYVDVGLKLDVEPRITMDDFVNIKIGLEVSSLGEKTVTKSGSTVYTIGTRNANTILRLKDGETQILAGLISDDERKNASRLPGLGDIPLLGRLFGNQEDRKNKTEIVLSITPRILGNIHRPEADVSEYWSGTDSTINDRPQTNASPVIGGGRQAVNNAPAEQPVPADAQPAAPQEIAPPPANPEDPPAQGSIPGLAP